MHLKLLSTICDDILTCDNHKITNPENASSSDVSFCISTVGFELLLMLQKELCFILEIRICRRSPC